MLMEGTDHVLFASVALIRRLGLGGSGNAIELTKLYLLIVLHNQDD